ncbi:MAG: asparagine synthetase B family protein [Steroidobacteraceae bacterium]
MGGIVGIVGDGSLDELAAMAARLDYRGRHLAAFSPAPGVYLGEVHHASTMRDSAGVMCLDADGALYPRTPGDSRAPAELEAADRGRLLEELQIRGTECLKDVTGHFALAHWNASESELVLASDRQGLKTFYCVALPGRTAFASDYKALLALPDCPAELDRDVLQTYLVLFSCPPARSLLRGVTPLSQAAMLRIRDGRATPDRFWVPSRRKPERSFRETALALRSRLESAITGQLAGHGRVGLLLSGGFDSAALLALVRHVRPDLEICTYTIGHGATDPDILGARRVAEHYSAHHHELFFDLSELPAALPRMVWLTEDLSGREEAVLQPEITALACASERLVLAGHGADAVFGGMPRHRILWLRDRSPPPLRDALCELFVYTRYKRPPKTWLGRRLIAQAYRGDVPEAPVVAGARAVMTGGGCPSLDRYLEEHTSPSSGFLHDEPVLAGAGAAILMPFLDPVVTDFALGCPGSYHIGLREQKRLLRASVADLMPQSMLRSRKTIQRFRHDVKLADALIGIADELELARSLSGRTLLSEAFVRSLTTRDARGTLSPERLHALYALICAELWLRQFVDRRGRPNEPLAGQAR